MTPAVWPREAANESRSASPLHPSPERQLPALSDDQADRASIAEVLNGRKDSFSAIVLRHQTRVHRFLLRHTQQADDALDLAQEAFVQAYLQLPGWRGDGKFSTWLMGIALNLARNHANRSPHLRHAHEAIDAEAPLPSLAGPSDPASNYQHGARQRALLAAIAQLPAELREPLLLVAVEDVPYEETAALLALPIGTLKSRLNRARRLLRETLADHLED